MNRICILATVACVFMCLSAQADHIMMRNGDRLTGEILESNRNSLTIRSEFAGTVTVQWEAIEEISSEQPLYLRLQDSQTIVGTLHGSAGTVEVRTRPAGVVTLRKDAIESIRSEATQTAYLLEMERLQNPGLLDLWSGTADGGLSLTRGNADTTNLALAFRAARDTSRDRITVYATSIYATNSTRRESMTTANAIRGGARYNVNISDRHFVFGQGDLEFDEFQQLDLRTVLGVGYGWHWLRTERTTFDVFGGGSFNKELFSSGLTRSSGEALIGESLFHKLSDRTHLEEKLAFSPNLSQTGEYRLDFDLATVTQLNSWFNWHVSLSDRFLSNPLPGIKKNDVLLTTGIRIAFGE